MARRFKIDILNCGKDVLRLAREGKTSNYICNWLWEVKRFKVAHTSIEKYILHHGLSFPDERVNGSHNTETQNAIESIGDPIEIDIDAYKKLWDIPDCLDSPEKIIAVIQRATAQIHVLNCMIVHASMTAHIDGKDRYPKTKVNGLKVTHDVMSQSWGLTQTIDVNAALTTLEKHGDIDAIRLIEES